MSIISNLIHKQTSKTTPSALCFFFDGKFDNELASCGVNLFGYKEFSVYDWSANIAGPNIHLIPEEEIFNLSYDFIIFNSLYHFYDQIKKFPRLFHLPAFVIHHEDFTESPFHIKKRIEEAGNIKVISTKNIKYGIEKIENATKNIKFLVSGNFQKNDYHILEKLHSELPGLVIIGENPDLECSINPFNYDQYRRTFAECDTYINLVTQKTLNYEVLWALANNAKVISLKTKHLEPVKENILFGETIEDLIEIAKENRSTPDINLDQFSMNKFKNYWSNIISEYNERIYTL